MTGRWRRRPEDFVTGTTAGVAPTVRRRAAEIVAEVRAGGASALRRFAQSLDDLAPEAPLLIERSGLDAALAALGAPARVRLERVAARIRRFAEAQRACLRDLSYPVEGGAVGHTARPVAAAGCYAPGGRYPLPSSVLMTALTARVAGVGRVWVASPRPTRLTLAAAALAGVDGLLAVGGAQAIAALSYGVGGVDACAVVVGPGNDYVVAAKLEVAGAVALDSPAGPSELLVVADGEADPDWIAADLLAQAEHDPRARPMLLATSRRVISAVVTALERQLEALPTCDVALEALEQGGLAWCAGLEAVPRWVDEIAPEHLHLSVASPETLLGACSNYGTAFLGQRSAEVFGDYGVGPNHVLPTGGSARAFGGLSIRTFLRWRPWVRLDSTPQCLVEDVAWLAEQEGLAGHAAAAQARGANAGELP